MQTLDLFGPAMSSGQSKISFPMRRIETPAARNTDPLTSHEAAEAHTRTGKRQSNIKRVAWLVAMYPGKTSAELSQTPGYRGENLSRHEIARRLPDAQTAGLVRKGRIRQCAVSGRRAVTWWPI